MSPRIHCTKPPFYTHFPIIPLLLKCFNPFPKLSESKPLLFTPINLYHRYPHFVVLIKNKKVKGLINVVTKFQSRINGKSPTVRPPRLTIELFNWNTITTTASHPLTSIHKLVSCGHFNYPTTVIPTSPASSHR